MAPPRNSAIPAAIADELGEGEEYIDEEPVDGEELVDDQFADPDAAEAALEAEARRGGWRPLAEYRGPAGKWLPAAEFLARGETFVPFIQADRKRLRDENQRIQNEIATLRDTSSREMAQMREDMRKLLDFSRKAGDQAYARARAELEGQQDEAAAAGDVTTVKEIRGRLTAMDEARAESSPPEPAQQPQPRTPAPAALAPEYIAFFEANPWVNSDQLLNKAMILEHEAIIEESAGMALDEQLEAAKERVVARFPKKFGRSATPALAAPQTPRPRGALPPRGGVQPQRQAPAGETINSIADPSERAEARKAFNRFKESMPDMKESEFMAVREDPHGDVLATMDKNKTSKKGRASA